MSTTETVAASRAAPGRRGVAPAHAMNPWDARATWALCPLVLGALASLVWLTHPWYEATAETNDASMYILSAKSLLAGEGYAYLGQPFSIRPPGMSAMIAALIAWRGLDFYALNLFVGAFGVAGVALLFVFARARLGTLLAFVIAIAVWLDPGYRHMCNQVMSDVPGAALFLACILVERWANRAPSWRRDASLGILIGLSAYVRTICVLIAPAIVLARAFEHLGARGSNGSWMRFARERVLVSIAATFLTLLPWSLRNARYTPEAPADQNYIYSYSTGLFHIDVGDPASPRKPLTDILARVPERVEQVLSHLGDRLRGHQPAAFHVAIGAVLCLCVLVVLVKRRAAAEIYALEALGVLLVYFGFRERLVLPIFLVAFSAAAEVALSLLRRFTTLRTARIAVATAIGALALFDFKPREGWDEIEAAHGAYQELAHAVDDNVPRTAVLASSIGWHDSLYFDRPVYSLLFAARRTGNMQGPEDVIRKYGVDTLVLASFLPADVKMLPYFEKRFGIAKRAGPATIVRVRP